MRSSIGAATRDSQFLPPNRESLSYKGEGHGPNPTGCVFPVVHTGSNLTFAFRFPVFRIISARALTGLSYYLYDHAHYSGCSEKGCILGKAWSSPKPTFSHCRLSS